VRFKWQDPDVDCKDPTPEDTMNKLALVAILGLTIGVPLAAQAPPGGAPATAAAIAIASSAAPAAIAGAATILDWPDTENGEPRTLRSGTNGWVCFPDMPGTPVNDPMCLDPVWQALFEAWSTRTSYRATELGLAYMLQGGADASVTDPFLLEPPQGSDWIVSGPHTMLVAPPGSLAGLPTDLGAGGPYVMWKGTPYEHVMMPVR
jgi:hypothetical protein